MKYYIDLDTMRYPLHLGDIQRVLPDFVDSDTSSQRFLEMKIVLDESLVSYGYRPVVVGAELVGSEWVALLDYEYVDGILSDNSKPEAVSDRPIREVSEDV